MKIVKSNLESRKAYPYDIKSLLHFDFPFSYNNSNDDGLQDEISNDVEWNNTFEVDDDSLENLLLKDKYKSKVPFVNGNESSEIIIENTPKFGYRCPLFTNVSYITGTSNNETFYVNTKGRCEFEFFIKYLDNINDNLIDNESNIFNDALIFNGHTFKIFYENLSWNDAAIKCGKLGGHLTTITSSAKQKFINGLIKVTNNNNLNELFWTGGIYNGNSWKWYNDEFLIYKNWNEEYNPNNTDLLINNSIALINNSWKSRIKTELHYYICEWDYNILQNISINIQNPYNYRTYTKHTYKIFNIPVTWEEANEICKSFNGNLVSINSLEEQQFINNIIKSPNSYWIGGNNYNGKWQWINNNENITKYTNWYENQPDSGENSCIRILSEYNGKWADDHSNDIKCYFICEWNTEKIKESKDPNSTTNSAQINFESNKNFYFENRRYQYFSEKLTWNEAVNKCKSLGGNLLTITSQAERDFVTDMILELEEDSDIWLGAYSDDEINWHWITGEEFNYTNWYDTSINLYNFKQRSVLRMIDGNYWIDEDNFYDNPDATYKFICEWGTENDISQNKNNSESQYYYHYDKNNENYYSPSNYYIGEKSLLKNKIIEFPNDPTTNQSLAFGIDNNGYYAMVCNDILYSSEKKPLYNEWQYLIVRINSGHIELFIDNELIFRTKKNIEEHVINNFNQIKIGRFNGLIDEFLYRYSKNTYLYAKPYRKIPKERYRSTLYSFDVNNMNIAVYNDTYNIDENVTLNMFTHISSINGVFLMLEPLQYENNLYSSLNKRLLPNDELLFIIENVLDDSLPDEELNYNNIGLFEFKRIKNINDDIYVLEEALNDVFNPRKYRIGVYTVPSFKNLNINEGATINPINNVIAFKVKYDCYINGKIGTSTSSSNKEILLPDKIHNNGFIFIGSNRNIIIDEKGKIGSYETFLMSKNVDIHDNFDMSHFTFLSNHNTTNHLKYNFPENMHNDVLHYDLSDIKFSNSKISKFDMYFAEGLPEGMEIDLHTGAIYGRCYIPGTYEVTIIHETQNKSETYIKTITVGDNDIDFAPSIIESREIIEHPFNQKFEYQINGRNLGEDPYYGIKNAPEGMIINHRTGKITWTIPNNWNNKNPTFIIYSDDENYGYTEKEIKLKLITPNEWQPSIPPYNIPLNPTIVGPGGIPIVSIDDDNIIGTIIYDIIFSDDDVNNLDGEYFIENNPNGMEIDPITGQIIWNLYPSIIPGTYTITFGKRDPITGEIYIFNKVFIFDYDPNGYIKIQYGDEDGPYTEININDDNPSTYIIDNNILEKIKGQYIHYWIEFDEDEDTDEIYKLPEGFKIDPITGVITYPLNPTIIGRDFIGKYIPAPNNSDDGEGSSSNKYINRGYNIGYKVTIPDPDFIPSDPDMDPNDPEIYNKRKKITSGKISTNISNKFINRISGTDGGNSSGDGTSGSSGVISSIGNIHYSCIGHALFNIREYFGHNNKYRYYYYNDLDKKIYDIRHGTIELHVKSTDETGYKSVNVRYSDQNGNNTIINITFYIQIELNEKGKKKLTYCEVYVTSDIIAYYNIEMAPYKMQGTNVKYRRETYTQ